MINKTGTILGDEEVDIDQSLIIVANLEVAEQQLVSAQSTIATATHTEGDVKPVHTLRCAAHSTLTFGIN